MRRRPKPKHPQQPLVLDRSRVIRFRENKIVRHMLDWASSRGLSMNDLAVIPFPREDREQFAELIGYSLCGAAELHYYSDARLKSAEVMERALLRRKAKR